MKKTIVAFTAAVLGLAMLAPVAFAQGRHHHGHGHHGHGHHGHGHGHWRHGHRHGHHHHHHHGHRWGYRHGHGWGWWAPALLGFGTGVIVHEYITRSEPAPAPVDGVTLCASQYKSFDPSTGTFLSLDGTRKVCPHLK